MESRIRGDVYVRFGGECLETYYSNIARRWVLTLLDFCFKQNGIVYNYPTLIFYQLGYSLFTIWQASRRHYRLNQREECRTYYMAVAGTVQQAVIGLIAQKMAATSAIQGKFSVEGLSAMAQGVDVKLKLAQALSNMDEQNGANLQEMFDVLQNDNDNDEMYYGKYRMMLTFKELLGNIYENSQTNQNMEATIINDIFDIFDMFDVSYDYISDNKRKSSFSVPNNQSIGLIFDLMDDSEFTPKALKKVAIGQMNLFGF